MQGNINPITKKPWEIGEIRYPAYNGTTKWWKETRWDLITKVDNKGNIIKGLQENDIQYISSVTFTGGEPTLNTKAIRFFMNRCAVENITIGNFYMVTNGKEITDEHIRLYLDLFLQCEDNETSAVSISNTDYHEKVDEEGVEKLLCLRFAMKKERLNYRYVIAEGRGKELAMMNGTIREARKVRYTAPKEEDGIIEEIYISANGNIGAECDISYKKQDKYSKTNVNTTGIIIRKKKTVEEGEGKEVKNSPNTIIENMCKKAEQEETLMEKMSNMNLQPTGKIK